MMIIHGNKRVRIRVAALKEPIAGVGPGDTGLLVAMANLLSCRVTQLLVQFDNGRRTWLMLPLDEIEVLEEAAPASRAEDRQLLPARVYA
jgi:hypothetical protein